MSGCRAWVVAAALAAAAAQAAPLPDAAGLSAEEALAALDADRAEAGEVDARDVDARDADARDADARDVDAKADAPLLGEGGYSPFAQSLSAARVSAATSRQQAAPSAQVADEPDLGWSAIAGLACVAGLAFVLRRAWAG
ncbi:MAG: hypothetical protein KF891_15280 [Rhizobacter sp.]|nr:hypothetical protein [Rhizobacter sp.]